MLAILTTHPIQYQVPLWQALARDGGVPFEVWYLSDHAIGASFDEQFKKAFAWDLNMLDGYPYRFLKVNKNSRVDQFSGLRLQEPLNDLFREKQVTALWVQGWQVLAYWQAAWQAHAAGIPVWMRGESNDLAETSLWKSALKRVVLGQLFRRIKYFLYIGSANRRLYEAYGIREEQLLPAPYCVDNDRFARQADELQSQRDSIRRDWKIPEDAFCILFAGKFISKKRPEDVINAVNDIRLRSLGRPLHLLFVGSGELGDKLRAKCQVVFDAESTLPGDGLNGHKEGPPASFAGFLNQTEIARAYVAADCMVLPSNAGETWGLVVNEALASGLPCIVSDRCGCGEDLITPIDPALRFRMGDPEDLGRSLLSAAQKRHLTHTLRNHVDKFSISVSVSTLRLLYK